MSSPSSPDDWQAEDDARTLTRAHEVKNDPIRMARAKKKLDAQASSAKGVLDSLVTKTRKRFRDLMPK